MATNIITAPNTKYTPLAAEFTVLKLIDVSSFRVSSTLLIAIVSVTTSSHGESINKVPHAMSEIDIADFILRLFPRSSLSGRTRH